MYKIIDNFLTAEEFDTIKETLMTSYFPWHYNDYTISAEHDNMPQFIHNFIRIENGQGGFPVSQFIDNLNPLFYKIENLATIVRCKANLTLQDADNVVTGMHVDTARRFNGFTSIFYLNDTDGGTKFENGDIVECKANRFVTFANSVKHSGILCTDKPRRIIVNINYTVWSDDETPN